MKKTYKFASHTHSNVVYKNFAEFGRQHMSGSLVATISNIGHQVLSLESSSHSVVNTFRFTPVGLRKDNTFGLITQNDCTYPQNLP